MTLGIAGHCARAVGIQPDNVVALNRLAQALATGGEASPRKRAGGRRDIGDLQFWGQRDHYPGSNVGGVATVG